MSNLIGKDLFLTKEDDPAHYVSNWKKVGQMISNLSTKISTRAMLTIPPVCVSSTYEPLEEGKNPSCISPVKGTLLQVVIRGAFTDKPPAAAEFEVLGTVTSSKYTVDLSSNVNTIELNIPVTVGAILEVRAVTPNINKLGFAALISADRPSAKTYPIELPDSVWEE